MHNFQTGKLNVELLERLLASNPISDERIMVGPKIGEDATVIDFGDTYLVAKTDPITFATDKIGWYAVNVNANDIATMGAKPRWFLASALLPEGKTDQKLVETIFQDIIESCRDIGATLCGGHTEITYRLDRPIIVGQMLGEVKKEKLVQNSNARPGDDIILTKGIAIEGTSIIAREKETDILESSSEGLDPAFLQRSRDFLRDPGISVVKDALVANNAAYIRAMHDPTEGGLATGLEELAHAAGAGLIVHEDRIKIYEESRILCDEFNLDPLGVIASGALLIVTEAADTENVVTAIKRSGIECSLIGKLTEERDGLKICRSHDDESQKDSNVVSLPSFEVDEITTIF